jgi:hypothetical protein
LSAQAVRFTSPSTNEQWDSLSSWNTQNAYGCVCAAVMSLPVQHCRKINVLVQTRIKALLKTWDWWCSHENQIRHHLKISGKIPLHTYYFHEFSRLYDKIARGTFITWFDEQKGSHHYHQTASQVESMDELSAVHKRLEAPQDNIEREYKELCKRESRLTERLDELNRTKNVCHCTS